MYHGIISEIDFPFGAGSVKGFKTENGAFWIDLKNGSSFKAFDMVESVTWHEFKAICRLVADRLLEGGK